MDGNFVKAKSDVWNLRGVAVPRADSNMNGVSILLLDTETIL